MKKIIGKNEIAELNKCITINDDCKFRQIGCQMVVKLGSALDKAIKNKTLSNKGFVKGALEEIECLKTMINSPEFTADEKKQFVFRISEINDKLAKNNVGQTLICVGIGGTIVCAIVCAIGAGVVGWVKKSKMKR